MAYSAHKRSETSIKFDLFEWLRCVDDNEAFFKLPVGEQIEIMTSKKRTAEATQALFNQWASTYDQDLANSSNNGPLTGYVDSLDTASNLLPVEVGQSVLDIGIGTGAFARRLQARGAIISGIDPATNMLKKCRELNPEYRLAIGSFTNIPYFDEQFDAIVASFAFHEVDPQHRETVCQEVARQLKPKGYLCLLDIMFASSSACESARHQLNPHWDDTEDYPLVADLDKYLYASGFQRIFWHQTALCHWVVLAQI